MSHITAHVEVLFSCFDNTSQSIAVHLNKEIGDDYPRMAFAAFTLARVAEKTTILTEDQKLKVYELYKNIYEESKMTLSQEYLLYVQLYGMRMLRCLKKPYDHLINDFRQCSYQSIYTYPVSMYVFMSTYKECELLRESYPFSKDIFDQCQKVFDFIISSNKRGSFLPFHFAELSLLKGYAEEGIIKRAKVLIEKQFGEGYLTQAVSASGVAKCMEDFTRRGDMKHFDQCREFLEKRSLARFSHYMRPTQAPYAHILFTEEEFSQYVCIDTNAHLIHTYLNLYEKY